MRSICVFGDSIAKGVAYDTDKKRYTFIKDSFINLFSRQNNIETANYAKFGMDIQKGADLVNSHITELSDYDYTIIEFGGNDCNFDWASIAKNPEKEHLPLTPIVTFKQIYQKLIFAIKSAGARPIMLNLPPLNAQSFYNWVSKGINAENILKWLGDVDHIFRWHREYNEAVCEIAVDNNVPLIDIRSCFTMLGDYSDFICIDGMHINEKGHKLVADKLCNCALSL